jgi:hypothetical protein
MHGMYDGLSLGTNIVATGNPPRNTFAPSRELSSLTRIMIRNVLALLLLAASARADDSALLDRWIAAAGGRQRLESVAAIHRVDAIDEDGMAGVREEWTTSALQRREQLSHTRDEATTVFDGTHGWRRDWNGFVENLAGSDLRGQSDLVMIHSFAALTSAAGAPSIIGDDTLEFHTKGGSAVRFVLDRETALPLRAEMASFDGIRTVAFSDWRKVDGVAIAFGETWTTGPNKTTAHLQSIEFIPRDRVDLSKPSAGAEDAFYLREGAGSETLPFNQRRRADLVPRRHRRELLDHQSVPRERVSSDAVWRIDDDRRRQRIDVRFLRRSRYLPPRRSGIARSTCRRPRVARSRKTLRHAARRPPRLRLPQPLRDRY